MAITGPLYESRVVAISIHGAESGCDGHTSILEPARAGHPKWPHEALAAHIVEARSDLEALEGSGRAGSRRRSREKGGDMRGDMLG